MFEQTQRDTHTQAAAAKILLCRYVGGKTDNSFFASNNTFTCFDGCKFDVEAERRLRYSRTDLLVARRYTVINISLVRHNETSRNGIWQPEGRARSQMTLEG